MMITFTGGEPTLRRDLEEIIAEVAHASPFTYLTLITHGGMLTVDRAQALWDAGLVQFSISLDYLDERHDIARGIPGLAAKILGTVPELTARGMTVRFNTVIKNDNIDDIMPIVRCAQSMGAGANLSIYTDFKNGNTEYLITDSQIDRIDALVAKCLCGARSNTRIASSSALHEGLLRQLHVANYGADFERLHFRRQ